MTTVIIALLSAFFIFASSIKILGWQKFIFETQLGMFVKYGLNRQIMFLVGVVELGAALAIWVQSTWLGPFGALTLLGISVGAIGCHLIWDTWKDAIPAVITTTLSALVLWLGWPQLTTLLG